MELVGKDSNSGIVRWERSVLLHVYHVNFGFLIEELKSLSVELMQNTDCKNVLLLLTYFVPDVMCRMNIPNIAVFYECCLHKRQYRLHYYVHVQ